jgi:hypothetical protein
MATKKTQEDTINPEHERLIEVLKFVPCTYSVQMWGYGGEYAMGTVDRKVYNYFKQRRLDLSDFAWDSDYAEDNNIPEDMWPFPPGSWYECDNMCHVNGVDMQAGTLQISDENGDTVLERELESIDGMDIERSCGDEVWIDSKPKGTVVFIGASHEKGTFFEGEIYLKEPFDPEKLCINYDEIDGNEIVSGISYDGEDIDNNGGGTNGKSSDFGFYIAGSDKHDGNGYEKYRNMDDIAYGLTSWFPKKVVPVMEGVYNIKTAGRNSSSYPAKWTGTRWIRTWDEDIAETQELKIKEWQGIAYDPDEHFLREELDQIIADFEPAMAVEEVDADVTKGKWPF